MRIRSKNVLKGLISKNKLCRQNKTEIRQKAQLQTYNLLFRQFFGLGYRHKKDINGHSLHPKSYPIKNADKEGANLSEIGRQLSDIVYVA
jgi:hypothetical protein